MCEAMTLILTNFHLGTQIQFLRESITKDEMNTRNRFAIGFTILFTFGGSAGVGMEWRPGVVVTAAILVIYYTLTTKFLRMQLRTFKNDNFKDEIRSINCQNWTFLFCTILLMCTLIITVFFRDEARGIFGLMITLMICTNAAKVLWDFHFIFVHRRVFREAVEFLENRESFGPSEDTPNDIFVLLSQ